MSHQDERVALVTGTSSGIGAEVAAELLRRGWRVMGVSRRRAAIEDALYTHLTLDLADTAGLMAAMDSSARAMVSEPAITRLALVNNAALVGLLGPVAQLDPAALLEVYAVNVAAPVALQGWILRRGRASAAVRIVNVSSGAAVQPLPGLGAYGSSKAALRMAGMILAAELDAAEASGAAPRDATILSFEPGIVDTEMQAAVRGSSPDVMPMVEFFKQAAAGGLLAPPALPAGIIADYLDADGHPRFTERRLDPPPLDGSGA